MQVLYNWAQDLWPHLGNRAEISHMNPRRNWSRRSRRVLNKFYGIRDLRAKSRRDSGLKVCGRVRMPEITLVITGLQEILSRDYGIEGPY